MVNLLMHFLFSTWPNPKENPDQELDPKPKPDPKLSEKSQPDTDTDPKKIILDSQHRLRKQVS